MYLHRASWHSSATLTEVFPCFFLSFKANARVKPAKTGHDPHSSKTFVFFYILFVLCRFVYCVCVCVCVCKWVLYYCHRMATQLQLTKIPCSILEFSRQTLEKYINIKFCTYPSKRNRVPWRTDLMKLIVAFCSFAKTVSHCCVGR